MPDDQTTADELRDRVDELERQIAELQRSGDVGRRRVLAALAGAAGLGAAGVHLGSAPASAQAAGQVGTTSDPVDVFGYNVQAENGVETPSLTDADTGTTYDIGTFTEGEVLSDEDGDGVYTLPSGSVGIDVPEVSTGSVNTKDFNIAVDVSQFDGQSLAHRVEAAAGEFGSQDLYVPNTPPDGSRWEWSKSISLTTNNVNIFGVGGVDIDYTVDAGNGPLLHLNGGDHRVRGLKFRSKNNETPDYGILVEDAAESKVSQCFVQGADIGFEIRSGSLKSTLQWCRTDLCETYGINVDTVSNCTLRQSYTARTDGTGIRCFGANAVTLRTCSSDKNNGNQLLIDQANGYGIYNFTCEVMDASTPNDYMVNITGSTNGVYFGGFLNDGGQGLTGVRLASGWHSLDGAVVENGTEDDLTLVSSSSTGSYGGSHPLVDIGGGWRNPSWTDNSIFALVYVNGSAVIPTDLTDSDQPEIRFEGEERYHDGSGSGNPEGPARALNGSWFSIVDGSEIS